MPLKPGIHTYALLMTFHSDINKHHHETTTMRHSLRFHFNAWGHHSPARPLQYLKHNLQSTHQFSPQNNHETFQPFPLQCVGPRLTSPATSIPGIRQSRHSPILATKQPRNIQTVSTSIPRERPFKALTSSHHKTTMKHSNRFHFNAWNITKSHHKTTMKHSNHFHFNAWSTSLKHSPVLAPVSSAAPS